MSGRSLPVQKYRLVTSVAAARHVRRALVVTLALFLSGVGGRAGAQDRRAEAAPVEAPKAGRLILGEIESIKVRDLSDPASGGVLVVKGKRITIPDNLLIGLPAGRMTLRNLVMDGPQSCTSQVPLQSGLAVSDTCRTDGSPALARIVAKPDASGELVAALVMVLKDSATTLARMRRPGNPRVISRAAARVQPRQQQ